MKRFQTYLKEANAIDTMQGVLDIATLGGSFIPGLNLASAAVQSISAGVDAAQGQYGEARLRAGQAALSAIPFGRAAGAATKLGKGAKAARATKVIGAVASEVGPAAAKWAMNKLMRGMNKLGPGFDGAVGGNVGYVSSLAGKRFDVVDLPKSLVHDIVYR